MKIYRIYDTGLEADSILEFNDGEYAAIEIKLGFGEVKESKDPETGIYIVP